MKSPNYKENPEYYKQLIAKINEEADFSSYLSENGYALIKRSVSSMEFKNDEDRIVLQTARNPITYFNRNDSLDKGFFFKFLLKRSPNFYIAVKNGLEITKRSYNTSTLTIAIKKPERETTSLEENYHIVPLRNSTYLKRDRKIAKDTINSPLFKGRIFNAYHNRDNGGKIANIAFPKYDLQNTPKNYILYNKPYRSKTDHKIHKFRLVLNKKDHFLFYSKPIENPKRILFGESCIDLLSYHELHGKIDDFYISFEGYVYQEKLTFFMQLISPYLHSKTVALVSLMDNDPKGYEFDLKVFTTVINQYNKNIYISSTIIRETVSIQIHYTDKIRAKIPKHRNLIHEKITSALKEEPLIINTFKCIGFSDKLLLEFSPNDAKAPKHIEQKGNLLLTLLHAINTLYLPFKTSLHKSIEKDWNDALQASKNTSYLKMEKVIKNNLSVGDKIKLNTIKGPEGTTNIGIIKSIKENGIECDFGLHYTYAIPYSSIASHFKKITSQETEKQNNILEKNSKNSTLQTHTL